MVNHCQERRLAVSSDCLAEGLEADLIRTDTIHSFG